MGQEYPVPGFPDYKVTEDGVVVSYKRNKRTERKVCIRRVRTHSRLQYSIVIGTDKDGNKKSTTLHRVVAAAKYGRWPEGWEQVRHLDGDYTNNSMANLAIGDALNNIIDDYEIGKRQTTSEYLDIAIARLMDLRTRLQ